jgi:hypothetical protein
MGLPVYVVDAGGEDSHGERDLRITALRSEISRLQRNIFHLVLRSTLSIHGRDVAYISRKLLPNSLWRTGLTQLVSFQSSSSNQTMGLSSRI